MAGRNGGGQDHPGALRRASRRARQIRRDYVAVEATGADCAGEAEGRRPAPECLEDEIGAAIEARRAVLEAQELEEKLKTDLVDVTLPSPPAAEGRVHPISQTIDEIVAIFGEMGFAVAEGPDIEDDFHNFTALNIPPEHPARQMHDTFYLPERADGSRLLLRTHTSPVQVRTMQRTPPPLRIIAPGRTYRCDSDMTHTPMFHQVEGLVVDETTHMGHLKGCIVEFCRAFFRSRICRCASARASSPSPNLGRGRYRLLAQGRRAQARQLRRLAGDHGLRHGPSARARRLRHRSQALSRFRLRHGH
jgi:hypothetical protein